ncbi:F-box protein-like protein [Emericellopsis cladophorae]|uniref:F-box protein-like protein n=1 Tax=Emericellopsis cladophorae TaxID=2686198 RepID=A0A9P9XY02_9HYPO|nr:F-box protein-like protein [Emericellopsis cladophorae]KAI6779613.1 F-box protein-like protein [Emericellopsis cladophorae]
MPSAVPVENGLDQASDSIPSHPLGVKPLGNQYFHRGEVARSAIGTWASLPEEMLTVLLEYLDVPGLFNLGHTCKYFYAICHLDDFWKALFLSQQADSVNPVRWAGTWRSTVLGLQEQPSRQIDCSNVFSDVLHRPFACSNINLQHYVTGIPKANQIRRFDNLSYEEFAKHWTSEPFVLSQCIQDWPVTSQWTIDSLLKDHGNVTFRAEAVDWTFKTYCQYMTDNADESPLYLFDRGFAEKMGIKVGRDADDAAYWRPDCFGPDFFEVLGDERPAHRWLIVGPERSGSTFHKDPNATSAWNAVIQGSKYWIMFPPTAHVPGVYVSKDSSEVTSPLSIAEWLLTFHEEARQLPECVEGICDAGEILHVPSGWWHLVVNLEAGIALTQNFVPKSPSLHHLSEAISFLRDKADQVSGFRSDIENPYELFAQRLGSNYPEALEKAVELAGRKSGKKRKWDAAVAVDETESGGGGFSFCFGGDDEDIA